MKVFIKNNKISLTIFTTVAAIVCLLLGMMHFTSTSSDVSFRANNVYSETIVVVADRDFEPYSFMDKNGNIAGYDVEMMYALADTMQKNVVIYLMSWSEALDAVKKGKADLLLGLEYMPTQTPELEVSMPLHSDPFVAFGKNAYFNISELYDKKIAVLENSGIYPLFVYPYKLDSKTASYKTYSEVFESVKNGENDFAIARYSVGRRALARLDSSDIKAAGPILSNNNFCMAAKSGNEKLIDALDAAIVKRISDGTSRKLSNKWLGRYVEIISFTDFLRVYLNIIIIVVALSILLVLLMFIYSYRQRLKFIRQKQEILSRVFEYEHLLTETTKGLYASVYEYDLTNGLPVGESTKRLFDELVLKDNKSYNEMLEAFAKQKVKEEYQEEFLHTFATERLLESFACGMNSFSYEFLMKTDGDRYSWIRVSARLFSLESDKSVRMIEYLQDVTEEKEKEQRLIEDTQRDSLTNLYNKRATEHLIEHSLLSSKDSLHAFFMLDIDNFKSINDSFGHLFGDFVICEFASAIKSVFRESDIIGRVGGDEFAIFLKNFPNEHWLNNRAKQLAKTLHRTITIDNITCMVSSSIGIAVYPKDGADFKQLYKKADKALYISKERGKNRFYIYGEVEEVIK